MKHNNIIAGVFWSILLLVVSNPVYSQAFHKGSFQVNLTEGWTSSTYSTNDMNTNTKINMAHLEGDRDPLSIEYGISNHWGIGLSSGNDIFHLNPTSFYSFETPVNPVKVSTTEFTIDGSYHFFVTYKTDVSAVASFGSASVAFKGGMSDYSYQYTANGCIVRLGLHARHFFCKHLGFVVMASAYSETVSTTGVKGNTIGNNYSTTISGTSLEMGLCFRFKR